MTLLNNYEDIYKVSIATTHFYYGSHVWEIFVGVTSDDYGLDYELTEAAEAALVGCIAQSITGRCASTDSIEIEIVAGMLDGKRFGWAYNGNDIENWKLGKTSFLE